MLKNSFLQKLAIATTSTALSLAVIDAIPASAAILTYDFTVQTFGGNGTFEGSFRFDEASVTEAVEKVVPLLDFRFDFLGIAWTNSDFNGGVLFSGGVFEGLRGTLPFSKAGSEFFGNAVFGEEFPIGPFQGQFSWVQGRGRQVISSGVGIVSYSQVEPPVTTPVPESGAGSVVLSLGALLLADSLRKKIAASTGK